MPPASQEDRGPSLSGRAPFSCRWRWLPPLEARRALVRVAPTLLLAACASAGGPARPGPEPEAAAPEPPAEAVAAVTETEARAVLDRIASLAAAGDGSTAARTADSAYFRWRDVPGGSVPALHALAAEAESLDEAGEPGIAAARLRELLETPGALPAELEARAAEKLASLHLRLGRAPGAVEVLARYGSGVRAARRMALFRSAAGEMSPAELEEAADLLAGGPDEAEVFREELAGLRMRLRGDDLPPVRVGVVLPLSGELASVGRMVREGMELALADTAGGEATSAGVGRGRIELVFRDGEGDPATAAARAAELESSGVAAILGPLRSAAFDSVVARRRTLGILVVSPTATDPGGGAWNAFSLWDRRARERAVATATGGWLARDLGAGDVGLVRPATAGGRRRELDLRVHLAHAGSGVSVVATYDPARTTHGEAVLPVAAMAPAATFVDADDARTVLQMASQLSFYGLRESVVAGGPAWADPAVVGRLRDAFPGTWIAADLVDREDAASAWQRYRAAFERTHDRSVPPNPLPALGYDAVRLVALAVAEAEVARAGAVARAVRRRGRWNGASGGFALRDRGGPQPFPVVTRTAVVRMAREGELMLPDAASLRAWRRSQARVVEAGLRRRAQQAGREVEEWAEAHPEAGRSPGRGPEERAPAAGIPGAGATEKKRGGAGR